MRGQLYIEEVKEHNRGIVYELNLPPSFCWKEYTLQDYADKRKSTNLIRFDFCPYCGRKIDWKKIKNEEVEE